MCLFHFKWAIWVYETDYDLFFTKHILPTHYFKEFGSMKEKMTLLAIKSLKKGLFQMFLMVSMNG